MNDVAARECARLLATLIGEIMEDHAPLALAPPPGSGWAERLRDAGEDIATLAAAIAIVGDRSEASAPDYSR